MSECAKYLQLMQNKIDDQLSEIEEKMLNKHLANCTACAKDYQAFEQMTSLFQKISMEEPPAVLKEMVMSEIASIEIAEAVTNKVEVANKVETVTNKEASLQLQLKRKMGLKTGIGLLIFLAIINASLFFYRIIPFLDLEKSLAKRIVIYQVLFQFFNRFTVIGYQLGDIFGVVFKSAFKLIPWNFMGILLIPLIVLILCLWSLIRLNKKGGYQT